MVKLPGKFAWSQKEKSQWVENLRAESRHEKSRYEKCFVKKTGEKEK